ncbi:hypothetical protein NCG89_11700 [Spongiibacter taiwanensis]|uniref:hypothetical protein n=1 Tax=Spongiibacter taiwanensis TaxID=1748242 RepID=UPI0020358EFB|nr:hypothetical protein [Spongiibacter taiwanensis]USA42185.1 hypothetical protein NCG89_11700 [Spongiibacter taiwanensis]
MQGGALRPWRRILPRLIFGLGISSSAAVVVADPWPWGEQFYGAKFPVYLEAHNTCKSAETIQIQVVDLPYLTIQNSVNVPAEDKVLVSGMVQLPPEPPPPLMTGLPGEPGWGHVPVPPFFVPPGQMPPPTIHQPNFGSVSGSVVLTFAGHETCSASRVEYVASGHMHFRPPEPDSGPEEIHRTDVCRVYWNIGEPPANLGDEDCTLKMRGYADEFVKRILAPYTQNDPQGWLWLSAIDIPSASIDQLLLMKARASAQTGNPGSGDNTSGEYAARWESHTPAANPCAAFWEGSAGLAGPTPACVEPLREATLSLARQAGEDEQAAAQIRRLTGPELAQRKDALRGQLAARSAPVPPPPAGGDCGRAWQKPTFLEKDMATGCRQAIQQTAGQWREEIAPLVATHPKALSWMPSKETIQSMGSNELLMIKRQVDELKGRAAK